MPITRFPSVTPPEATSVLPSVFGLYVKTRAFFCMEIVAAQRVFFSHPSAPLHCYCVFFRSIFTFLYSRFFGWFWDAGRTFLDKGQNLVGSFRRELVELQPFCACRLLYRAGIVMLWSCGSFYRTLPNFFRWQAGTLFMQFRAWTPVPISMFMRLELPSAMPNFMWLTLPHFHHNPQHNPHNR